MSDPIRVPASRAVPGRTSSSIRKHPLEFTGQGSEYFRIWLVNVVLMILTLGFYTPFARRRTVTYFYNHSRIAGSPLTFSASMKRMMFGFLVITSLYVIYEVAAWLENELATNLLLGLAAIAAPFLWGSAMRFRTRATRWRGLRPVFRASWGEIYRQSWPIFAIAAIGVGVVTTIAMDGSATTFETASEMSKIETDIAVLESEIENADVLQTEHIAKLEADLDALNTQLQQPPYDAFGSSEAAFSQALRESGLKIFLLLMLGLLLSLPFLVLLEFNYRRLFVKRTQIGQLYGHWKPVYADFLRVWLATFGLGMLIFLVISIPPALWVWSLMQNPNANSGYLGLLLVLGAGLLMLWITLLFFALSPVLAYREARMFQLMWNNIGLGGKARFKCELSVWRFVGLRVLNSLLTGITLGFYRPFALVAEYRMKFESVVLYVKGDLDSLEGQLSEEQGALGDAFADAMGLDLIG